MANTHWLTNRGKLLLIQGAWDDEGASDLYFGLLSGAAVPAAMDTEAEIQDLNTVNDLLALTGVDEPAGGWYSRKNLVRSAATQDDTNNRVNMDAGNLTWASATLGDNIFGGFWANEVGTDSQDELIGVVIFASVIPTNGSDLTLTIADLVRAS